MTWIGLQKRKLDNSANHQWRPSHILHSQVGSPHKQVSLLSSR